MRAAVAQAQAFVVRDFRIERSYRLAFMGQVAATLVFLASFGVVSPLVSDGFAERFGTGYFGFAAVGIAVSGALLAALSAFSDSVRQAQLDGTLEATLMAPVPRERLVAMMGLWPLVLALVGAAATVAVAAVAGAGLLVHPLTLALVAPLSLGAFAALGLASGAVILVVKRGGAVAALVGMLAALAAGAYAPTATLPGWLQAVAAVNPMTYALDAWRGALLTGRSPAEVAVPLAVLAAVAVAGIPLALALVRRAVDAVRADGTLNSY